MFVITVHYSGKEKTWDIPFPRECSNHVYLDNVVRLHLIEPTNTRNIVSGMLT